MIHSNGLVILSNIYELTYADMAAVQNFHKELQNSPAAAGYHSGRSRAVICLSSNAFIL